MKEVEVKAKVDNLDALKEKLVQMGCVFSEPLVQKDKIYLHKSMKFSDMGRGKVILRIRRSDDKATLNLKKQLENELDNIEEELVIDNAEAGTRILKYLDFDEVVRVSKRRTKGKLNDLKICLDDVDELGTFIEVEKMTEDEDSLKIQEELFEFLESLGVKRESGVLKGYDTLIEEKMK